MPGWLADSVAIALEELGVRLVAMDEGKTGAKEDEATLARAGTLLDAVLSDASVPPVAAAGRWR